MPPKPDPTILAFDTSAAHCAAALLRNDSVASRFEEMSRGQGERLLVLLEEVLAEHKTDWADLDALAVGVGPGNFTGIRISVSAARGLALGLGIPAIHVSTFELMRDPYGIAANAAELVVVEAPRGAAYAQPFRYGRPTAAPEIIDPSRPPEHFRQVNLLVTGHQAVEISNRLGGEANPTTVEDPAGHMARIAQWKFSESHDVSERPAPLYVRAPDAAPPREKPPVILP